MKMTSAGNISRTTSDNCNSRTLTLFGFAEGGVRKAASSTLHTVSPYESVEYINVTVDQTTMTWHLHIDVIDSEDNRVHTTTLTWVRQ